MALQSGMKTAANMTFLGMIYSHTGSEGANIKRIGLLILNQNVTRSRKNSNLDNV